MKNKLFYTIGLIVLSMVAFAIGPAGAQTTANGPYYATPSWDQKLQCDTLATCPRFIVLLNWNSEAVLDRETGLVWERSPDIGYLPWGWAQAHCIWMTLGNRKGWRMPTVQELASLVDPSSQNDLKLPTGHPFINVQSSYYWSASTEPRNPGKALAVEFSNGGVDNADKGDGNHTWCVRGGQGVGSQLIW